MNMFLTLISILDAQVLVNPVNFVNQQFLPLINDQNTLIGGNQYNTIYQLDESSLTYLSFDFRHFWNYTYNQIEQFKYGTDWSIVINLQLKGSNSTINVPMPPNYSPDTVDPYIPCVFRLFVPQQTNLTVRIQIANTNFISEQYMFMNTTKVSNLVPKTAIADTLNIFIMIVQSTDQVNLPANILPMDDNQNYLPYIITYTTNQSLTAQNYATYNPSSNYYGPNSLVTLPYIPYFSNCQGYGQYMFFYELIQHTNCTLYSPDNVIPINPFSFGQQARADICNLLITCVVDEVYNNNPRLSRWFELQFQNNFFAINADPTTGFGADFQQTTLVQVIVQNQIPSGQFPLQVELDFNYYQIDSKTKRIISATMTYNNFYTLSDAQKNQSQQIEYTLAFQFSPLSQGKLVNNFALQWPVYVILYLVVGSILLVEVGIFFAYHYLMNRQTPRPEIKMIKYISPIYSEAVYGMALAFVPTMGLYIIVSIFMGGVFWTTPLSYAGNITPPTQSDPSSGSVFFDIFKDGHKYTDTVYAQIKSSRIGIALISCGCYIIYQLSYIYIKDEDHKSGETYNGNILSPAQWKRSRIYYCTIIMVSLMMLLIQFSFTNVFQNNCYYFLVLNKIFAMFIEYILEVYFDNNLLATPFMITVAIMINVSTMGNNTFYAFLISTVIDKAIEMIERAYIIKIQNIVTDYLVDKYTQLKKQVNKILYEDDEEQEQEQVEHKDDDYDDENDSNIIFSDDYQDNIGSDDESLQIDLDYSYTNEDYDPFEKRFKELLNQKQEVQQEEILEEEELDNVTELVDYYVNISNDVVTYIYTPYNNVTYWLFYSSSQLLSSYQVLQSQFLYYFLWNLIIIPFQILIDLMESNLIQQYHQLDFLPYLQNMIDRFKTRKNWWKADDNDDNKHVETAYQKLDQWCFSSQYYFITSLMICGINMLILGSQIIYVNQYNLFADQALIFVFVFWWVATYILHQIFKFVGLKLRIWQLSTARIFPVSQQLSIETLMFSDTSMPLPRVKIEDFEKAIIFREQAERIANYQFDFSTDKFRKQALEENWMKSKENLKLLLSPRTLKTFRLPILQKFDDIYGGLDRKTTEVDLRSDTNRWYRPEKRATTFRKEYARKRMYRNMHNLPEHSIAILNYWLFRVRALRKTVRNIGGFLEDATKSSCEFCGLNWGLQVETKKRVEDIYLQFLKSRSLKCITKGTEIDDWQSYFSKQEFQTCCFICNGFMVDDIFAKQNAKEKRRQRIKTMISVMGVFMELYRSVKYSAL